VGKKKFKDGLESLFSDVREDGLSKKSPLLFETGQQEAAAPRKAKPASGKHFSDDLELFFQESLKESIQEELSASSQNLKTARVNRSSRPKDGLDALIRRTVDSTEIELHYDESRRRVVLTFDREKLSKLKQIAKMEKTLLKDMISRVVADYIKEYEHKKGYLG
jgi:hypothetical protein